MKNILIIFGILFLPALALAQGSPGLSGKITDEKTGLPLAGATISIRGSKEKVTSDADGLFHFQGTHAFPVVYTISYVGYASRELSSKSNFTPIVLSIAEGSNLSDVVVVGCRPETDIAHLLQGASPGLQITFSSGEPGTTADLNIRGTTSINGGAPLVLLDNVPVASLSLINPADIESITILKDA
jgi:hypothetical protein